MAKDDTTYKEKVALRRVMMRHVEEPVILETHGGLGQLWAACYAHVRQGVVFEKRPDRAAHLAKQRPTWAVYKADCEVALAAGAGGHLMVNVLDLGPYGSPWPALEAFFESERPRADKLYVVVNDGLRQAVKRCMHKSIDSHAISVMRERYGALLFQNYLEACQELLKEKVAQAGYKLSVWTGYYCGHARCNTHYLAVLER